MTTKREAYDWIRFRMTDGTDAFQNLRYQLVHDELIHGSTNPELDLKRPENIGLISIYRALKFFHDHLPQHDL